MLGYPKLNQFTLWIFTVTDQSQFPPQGKHSKTQVSFSNLFRKTPQTKSTTVCCATSFLTRQATVLETMWRLIISQICLFILVTSVRWLSQQKIVVQHIYQESIRNNKFFFSTGHTFQDPSELLQFVRKDPSDQKFHCTLCGRFSHSVITCTRNHVESKHYPDSFIYPCDLCDQTFNSRMQFNNHKQTKHRKIKIPN